MTFKSICDGLFASTLSDDEFAELSNMTKRELAALYVDAQVAAGIIGEPADRADTEAYVSRQFRKIELIDGIAMFREMEEAADDTIDESECDMDVTRDIADITIWPASTTPVAMRIEESDDMRMGEDEDDPITESRSFAAQWCRGECPEIDLPTPRRVYDDIDEMVDEYAEDYVKMHQDFCGMWTPEELAAFLYDEVEKAAETWTDDDELALSELDSLLAYKMDDEDDHEDIVEEWTEWLVLAGELERVDTGDSAADAVWAWCPDHRAELPGSDKPIDSLDDARRIFDAYDPLGLWFSKRHAEAMAGEDPKIWRRYEVDLVCQTCTRDADGLISVRDDAVRLSKDFDVDGDVAAQALISSILPHI